MWWWLVFAFWFPLLASLACKLMFLLLSSSRTTPDFKEMTKKILVHKQTLVSYIISCFFVFVFLQKRDKNASLKELRKTVCNYMTRRRWSWWGMWGSVVHLFLSSVHAGKRDSKTASQRKSLSSHRLLSFVTDHKINSSSCVHVVPVEGMMRWCLDAGGHPLTWNAVWVRERRIMASNASSPGT